MSKRSSDRRRKESGAGKQRPFISVYFECCQVYQRIYLNRKGDAFVGWCPRCAGKAVVNVDPDAEPKKFFYAN